VTSSPLELPAAAPATVYKGKQPHLWTVLSPQWRSALARIRTTKTPGRTLLFAIIGLAFWSAVFGISYRVLSYFRGVEEIGSLLAGKMLSMALLAFGGILLLSNLVAALSTFSWPRISTCWSRRRWTGSASTCGKLGKCTRPGWWCCWRSPSSQHTASCITAVTFGSSISAIAPFWCPRSSAPPRPAAGEHFPARRTRDVLSLVAAGAAAGLVLLLRLMQPEQLARPEGFQSLVEFIAALQSPSSAFMPSEWSAQVIMNWLTRVGDPLPIALLWSTAGAFLVFGAALHTDSTPRATQGAGRRQFAAPGPEAGRLVHHARGCR
jgi:ABC-2 type transport system permease protein